MTSSSEKPTTVENGVCPFVKTDNPIAKTNKKGDFNQMLP